MTACNKAQFVQDITVPDGTVLPAGAAFRKTWRLLNVGSCTWTENYGLVFFSGDRLHVRPGYRLNRVVRPGDAVDVSADFVAPATPGRYRGNWMLIDASGVRFGIGPYGNNPFWVDIRVTPLVDGRGFDFAANMCGALWTNGRDTLPCPGNPGADSGSVSLLINPMFEGGRRENEPTLWTRPQSSRGGVIAGLFPAYKVRSGDRFLASIGCLQNSKGCDVTFYLDYKIAGQPRGNLGVWQEVYDGRFSEVEVDLSALAGQEVQFILQVVNNGKPAAANAFWFTPFILRAN